MKRTYRVLTPHMFASKGGVRSVMAEGLPRLRALGLEIVYCELCHNEADLVEMESIGVQVDRSIGITGSGIISQHKDGRRYVDLMRAVPRLTHTTASIRRAIANYDALYVHGYRELLMSVLANRSNPISRRIPIVWHCHGIEEGRLSVGIRVLASSCTAIIAVSQHLGERLHAIGVASDRLNVVPNAVNSDLIKQSATRKVGVLPRKSPGEITLLVASASLRPNKGAHSVVEALHHLPESYVLWLTGNPNDPFSTDYRSHLEAIAIRHGLKDRVHYIGRREDIWGVMAESDIVIVPSLCAEGFGLAAVEPMALGKPVIVSDRGALPEVVGWGEAGLVFNPDKPEELADCIRRVHSNPARTQEMTDNAQQRARDLYDYSRWSTQVTAIITSALIDRPPQ